MQEVSVLVRGDLILRISSAEGRIRRVDYGEGVLNIKNVELSGGSQRRCRGCRCVMSVNPSRKTRYRHGGGSVRG